MSSCIAAIIVIVLGAQAILFLPPKPLACDPSRTPEGWEARSSVFTRQKADERMHFQAVITKRGREGVRVGYCAGLQKDQLGTTRGICAAKTILQSLKVMDKPPLFRRDFLSTV